MSNSDDGWRILHDDEVVQPGDEFSGSIGWIRCDGTIGLPVSQAKEVSDRFEFRRPVNVEKARTFWRELQIGEVIIRRDQVNLNRSGWVTADASIGMTVTEHMGLKYPLARRLEFSGVPVGIEKMVCDDITDRQVAGTAKYGTTVGENDLSNKEWLQHAYEECLDMAIYLKRLINGKCDE